MIIPSYKIHVEAMTFLLSYHNPLVEPLLSHSVRPTLFCIQMSSCLLLGEPFGRLDLIQSRMWMTGIAHLLIGDLTSFDFFGLSYVRCHTGAYLVSDKIYRSSWSRTIISTYEIHIETRTHSLFYYDPPMEPSMSHLVKPAFLGIQMSSYFPF